MNLNLISFEPIGLKYIDKWRLSQIYESLLCGIAVMQPKKPHNWIIDKLKIIKSLDYDDLKWDSFIDECKRPKHPLVIEPALSFIFRNEDDNQPTTEMMVLAYNTYNQSMLRRCFNAWVIFHVVKHKNTSSKLYLNNKAGSHYVNVWLKKVFLAWKDWTRSRLNRQQVAFEIIQHLKQTNTCNNIFEAWNKITKESKKTREYFEKELMRLERGEVENEDDIFNAGDGEARDDLSVLPIVFTVKIFSQLSIVDLARCAQVCRSWKVITQNDSLWNKINFEDMQDILSDRVAMKILQRARANLCHLNMRGCTKLGPSSFLAVSECRNLQDLNLSECTNINMEWDELMDNIIKGCPVLTYLNVSYTTITDNALRCLAMKGEHIQYLSLAYCHRITDQSFEAIYNSRVVSKLVYVDLSGCNQLTVISYKYLSEACPKIKRWILNDIKRLSDEQVGAIATYCKKIEWFEARGANKLTDHSIKLILTKSLKVLKLETSQKLSDHGIKDIGRHCSDIHQLYLSDLPKISDQSLKHFTNLRHLRVINLADCVRITDQGVKFIVDSTCGPLLKELNLTNCLRITDSALNQIQKRCQQLSHLTVAFCQQFTEFGMEVLGSMPNLEFLDIGGTNCGDNTLSILGVNNKLKYLMVSGCPAITDLGLQKFTQLCRNIEHLDLSFCYQLTDAAIKNLVFCCRFITSLKVEGCRQLTDLSVQFLSGVCHYLTVLDVSGCTMITNKSLVYIRKGCRKLKELRIEYCKGITKKAVMRLNNSISHVQYSCEDPPQHYGYQ